MTDETRRSPAEAVSHEQPDFIYFECGDCGFDSIQSVDFKGSYYCPLCAGDSGHDVAMTSRVCRSEDTAEGFDARKGTRAKQQARFDAKQLTRSHLPTTEK